MIHVNSELLDEAEVHPETGSSVTIALMSDQKPTLEYRIIRAADAMLMKSVRLRSLADAPYAFGGSDTYAEEAALPDSYWERLCAELDGLVPAWKDRCVGYIVMNREEPCGTAGCYLCARVPRRAYFTAAWVDPRYRRQGIGRKLIELTKAWAISHGADRLNLWVDDTNHQAATFYEILGFKRTGENRAIKPKAEGTESAYELQLPALNFHRS